MMVRCFDVTVIIGGVVAFLSAAGIITLAVLWSTVLTPFTDYSLVIDAGSSHTKIFVYSWPADKSDGLGTTSRVREVAGCDVGGANGGPITSVRNPNLTTIKEYFNSAMEACINNIPDNRKSRTLIFLGATAGLRLFNISNPVYTENLLQSTRSYFSTLGLKFSAPDVQVRIISGSEEGLSGWITTNMLTRQLLENNKPVETYGVLDMGGASTQISFFSPNASKYLHNMNLFDTNYPVYSYSYLCSGQQETRNIYLGRLAEQMNGSTLIDDPCLQRNYSEIVPFNRLNNTACAIGRYRLPSNFTSAINITYRGTGDYVTCRNRIFEQIKICSTGLNCTGNLTYQPSLNGSSIRFLVMAAFYNVFDSLAPSIPLSSDSSRNYNLSSLNFTTLISTINGICNESWSAVVTNDTRFRPILCFNSVYHWTLVQRGYGVNDDNLKRFQAVRRIDSNEIGWTLGYMIDRTNYLDPDLRPQRLMTEAEFIGILACFVVLFIGSVCTIGLAVCFRIVRRRAGSEASTKSEGF